MKNPQNLTIGLLLVTAVALAAMLIGMYQTQDNAAYAVGAIKGGDYLMSAGSFSSARDLVYVVDIGSRRMNVYAVNVNANNIEMLDTVDLSRSFEQ